MLTPISRIDAKAYQEWLELCTQISNATEISAKENDKQRDLRKDYLVNHHDEFVKYYFPHYCTSEAGWFQKNALKDAVNTEKLLAVWEWPREHAKSVYANIILPMLLYATGELTGMILVSNNQARLSTY